MMIKKLFLILTSIILLGVWSLGNSTMALQLNGGNVKDIGGILSIGAEDEEKKEPKLITTIKNAINVVLGFMSLITLIILLWGGFQMVTANGDDTKFQAGMKLLKQAALGLLFIAVSWMMVSMIFWIIAQVEAKPG